MNKTNPNERNELIEKALHQAVSGGSALECSISCHIFSINFCDIDLCDIGTCYNLMR